MRTCPACGAQSPEGTAFCRDCGTRLSPRACPSCGSPDEPGRFCSSCGTALDAPAAAPAPAPAAAVDPPAPVAERRMTSVLFADLVGFTPLSESRDPEEVRELLSLYFTRCRAVIARYDGVVEKFIGDAVMAVWGVPVAHEDDAERAVRAGLDLAAMVETLGVELDAPLHLRVGIVTGEVAVTVGATAEGMVAGDAVNTAARVQSAASPGHVWVDGTTRELCETAFDFDDMGAHELKGKSSALRLWQVGRTAQQPDDRHRRAGIEVPLVGRAADLDQLERAFERVARERRPRLEVVEGVAGVGKSRLVREFEQYADGLPAQVRWHRGRCLAYGDGMAFRALAEAIRARLGVVESDPPEQVQAALDAALHRYVPDDGERAWLRPRIAVLLGVVASASYPRGDLFAAWTSFLEHVARDGDALVLVIDDAHHADEGLLDFLDHLLSTSRSPMLLLAVARPPLLQNHPDLGGDLEETDTVEPLTDDQMRELVERLVPGVPAETRDEIVSRAGGVPLFAVETVRALLDRGLVVRGDDGLAPAAGAVLDISALGPPATLQALVAARLDALAPAERGVVADASVLGKSFTVDALLALGWSRASLDVVLPALEHKEIVALQTDQFSAERAQYRFVQGVVQQVAYSRQSRRDRKARHLKAADYLSGLDDPADDLAVVTASHLLDAVDASGSRDDDVADLTARACLCLERAGHRARRLAAPSDAERLFRLALERSTDDEMSARLTLAVAVAANEASHYDVAVARAAEAVRLWSARGDLVTAGSAAAEQVVALVSVGENAAALSVGRPWWDRLDDVPGAEPALNLLARNLASASLAVGDVAAQRRYVERRLEIAQVLDDQRSRASASIQLGLHFMHVGEPDKARTMLEQGARIAREHDVTDSLAYALQVLGSSSKSRDVPLAVTYSEEAVVVARRTGRPLYIDYAVGNLAQALWAVPRLAEARAELDLLDATATEPLVRAWIPALDLLLCEADGSDPRDPVPLPAGTDSEPMQAWDGTAAALRALRAGDTAGAGLVAEQTLPHVLEAMGLDDDFLVLWPPLVRAAIASGDAARVERMLAPVADARQESVTAGVHAHWHLLRGLAAAGPSIGSVAPDRATGPGAHVAPLEVEADLRTAVEALERFGAVGDAARAREHLGRWLWLQGRHDEARPLVDAALGTYRDLGALGWLAAAGRWAAAHDLRA